MACERVKDYFDRELFPIPGVYARACAGGLSEARREILYTLSKLGFGDLLVTDLSAYAAHSHDNGVDLSYPDNPAFAFEAHEALLGIGWSGGLGLSIVPTNRHLHVDTNPIGLRFIETKSPVWVQDHYDVGAVYRQVNPAEYSRLKQQAKRVYADTGLRPTNDVERILDRISPGWDRIFLYAIGGFILYKYLTKRENGK